MPVVPATTYIESRWWTLSRVRSRPQTSRIAGGGGAYTLHDVELDNMLLVDPAAQTVSARLVLGPADRGKRLALMRPSSAAPETPERALRACRRPALMRDCTEALPSGDELSYTTAWATRSFPLRGLAEAWRSPDGQRSAPWDASCLTRACPWPRRPAFFLARRRVARGHRGARGLRAEQAHLEYAAGAGRYYSAGAARRGA